MTRRYDDPVDVRRQDEEPVQFRWRGRRYVVRDVLSHWVETGPWWADPDPGSGAPAAARVRGAGPGPGGVPAPAAARAPSPGLALDGSEREVWRVEASPGRVHGSGVYDLCHWSAGAWTLARAMD